MRPSVTKFAVRSSCVREFATGSELYLTMKLHCESLFCPRFNARVQARVTFYGSLVLVRCFTWRKCRRYCPGAIFSDRWKTLRIEFTFPKPHSLAIDSMLFGLS